MVTVGVTELELDDELTDDEETELDTIREEIAELELTDDEGAELDDAGTWQIRLIRILPVGQIVQKLGLTVPLVQGSKQ